MYFLINLEVGQSLVRYVADDYILYLQTSTNVLITHVKTVERVWMVSTATHVSAR